MNEGEMFCNNLTEKPFKKLAAIVVMCCLAFGMSACGSAANQEELIKKQVTSFFEVFKNPTEENLSAYVGEIDSSGLEQLRENGVDVFELLNHCCARYEYQINDVTVDGNEATANVTIKAPSIKKAMSDAEVWIKSSDNLSQVMSAMQTDGQKGFMKVWVDRLYEELDSISNENFTPTDISMKLNKNDKSEWVIADDSILGYVSALFGVSDISNL